MKALVLTDGFMDLFEQDADHADAPFVCGEGIDSVEIESVEQAVATIESWAREYDAEFDDELLAEVGAYAADVLS